MLLAFLTVLALTRAEIVQRMRAPVVTQASGLVRVYANCPEDMRRDFQGPVARCAADTLALLYRAEKMKERNFTHPRIIVHLGDVRTNLTDVVSRVTTNDGEVVTRLYLKSPGGADVERFRHEVTRAFYRTLFNRELSLPEAVRFLHAADPAYRVRESRQRIESWLAGDRREQGMASDEAWDEDHITLMRKVLEVGVASKRDILTFASRLRFYPPYFDQPFEGGRDSLTFAEALALSRRDIRIRFLAIRKAAEVSLFGSGRSEELGAATAAYAKFLEELSRGEKESDELEALLLEADGLLEKAWEKAK